MEKRQIRRPPKPKRDYGVEDFTPARWSRRRLGYRAIELASKSLSKRDRQAFKDAWLTGVYHLVTGNPAPGYPDEFTRRRIESVQGRAWREGAKAWGKYRDEVEAFHRGERDCPQKPLNPFGVEA